MARPCQNSGYDGIRNPVEPHHLPAGQLTSPAHSGLGHGHGTPDVLGHLAIAGAAAGPTSSRWVT